MLSQMLGMSSNGGLSLGASQAPQQLQAGKAAAPRQEEIELCMAVSIRMLHAAAAGQRSEAGNLLIHGKEVATVLLVAMVEEVVSQGSSIEILVNDSTGRLKLKYYVTEALPEEVATLRAGQYISVAGQPRVSPSLHVSIVAVRPIRTADEVSYHMIEVAHTALKIQQPELKSKGMGFGISQDVHTPQPKQQRASEMPQPGNAVKKLDFDSPPKTDARETGAQEQVPVPMDVSLPDEKEEKAPASLRDAILNRLRQIPSSGAGLEFSEIMQDVAKVPSASEADLRKMLSELVEEAEIFETIENHYAILSS